KIFVPLIIVVPGIIAFYYFGEQFYDNQDFIYPELVKQVMPLSLAGFFAAVILGAILSTFNSVLNSAATIFSLDLYKKIIHRGSSDKQLVRGGKICSIVLAVLSILIAPVGGEAREGIYQPTHLLPGIFIVTPARILLDGLFIPNTSAAGAKVLMVTALSFYLLTSFIIELDLHLIHIWGIGFVLNL